MTSLLNVIALAASLHGDAAIVHPALHPSVQGAPQPQACASAGRWTALLTRHAARYPRMEAQDAYKLLQHAALGSEHAVSQRAAAASWMRDEVSRLQSSERAEPLVDSLGVGGSYARVHLRPYLAAGGDTARLIDAFVATANAPGDTAVFRCARESLQALADARALPFSGEQTRAYLNAQVAAGLPAVHHGAAYEAAYQPAYRVVSHAQLRTALCGGPRSGAVATAICGASAVALTYPSSLPTGRVTYRTLSETTNELERMATAYPKTVRLFSLPNRSLLGQRVWAVEISRDVAQASGKPVFLMTGLHHSREWPTVELTMEFAWDILKGDSVDPRIATMLDKVRIVVVPVVNPDGYDLSRTLLHEQKRKNCRIAMGVVPTYAECADPANANAGVDLNRNYGAFWGGGGATIGVSGGSSRGEGPFSEPETRNIRDLMQSNQIVVALSNHTPDAKVLRVPSAAEEPVPADVVVYDSLAQELGRDMSWPAGPWPSIYYVASGTMEEMAYYSSGTLAFTFEHAPGQRSFHPPYSFVVDQYRGTGAYPNSNARAAFFRLVEAAANPELHSVLQVRAPAGATLTLSKRFDLETSPVLNADSTRGTALTFPVALSTTTTVPARGGVFTWHVNPSLRPSQKAQEHVPESWTLRCTRRGASASQTVRVRVARGDTAVVDVSSCR